MDVIVLGKASFKASEVPQVVYLGNSRSEARAAAAAKASEYSWIYQVNGMVIQNYKMAKKSAVIESANATTEEVTEATEINEPVFKKKKSK